ncbi:hypothetical protein PO909_013414 [Leuciscus waleckii]
MKSIADDIVAVIDAKISTVLEAIDNQSSKIQSIVQWVQEAEDRIEVTETTCTANETKIQVLEKRICDLTEQIDDLENRGRRCNVRIIGLPEDTEGTNPLKFFEKWIPDYLNLETKAGKVKLERAHRSLAPKPVLNRRPRPVIVRFHNFQDKQRVMAAASKRFALNNSKQTSVSQSKFMTMDNTLRICTWNVKGIHNLIKRKKVVSYIRKNKIGIALLQETHLDKQEHLKLKQGGYNQVYFSSFSSKSRGVAVLISKNIPLNVVKLIEDDRGRFVIINGTLFGSSISLFNIYFPPGHPSDFLIKTFADFYDLRSDYMIVAGDFNCMLNPLIDRFPHKIATPSKLAKQINGICEDLELTDVWRALHPSGKEYSFFSPPHQCYTRIDYFFIPRSSLHLAISCCINNIVISDHAMVVLELKSLSRDNFRQWRLNTNILRDKLFKPFFSTEFTSFYNINAQTTKDSSLLWETSKAYIRGLILSFSASKKRKKKRDSKTVRRGLEGKRRKIC